MHDRQRHRRSRGLVLGLLAVGLLVAACGSGGSEASTPTVASLPDEHAGQAGSDAAGEPDEVDPEAAGLAYERCMAGHGIDTETVFGGTEDGVGVATIDGADVEDFEAAVEECGDLLEDAFGGFELDPEQQAELDDAQAVFARCMSERGLDLGDGDGFTIELDEDTDIEAFEAAADECGQAFEGIEDVDGSGG